MNRLVRTLVGVVVAKAAVAAGWYLYQKSTELENDWKTEGEKEAEAVKPEPTKQEVETPVQPPVVEPVVEKVVKPARKAAPKVKKEVAKTEETTKPKRVVSSSVLSNDTILPLAFKDVQVSNQKLIRAKPEFRSPFIKNIQRFNRTAPATPFSVRTSS